MWYLITRSRLRRLLKMRTFFNSYISAVFLLQRSVINNGRATDLFQHEIVKQMPEINLFTKLPLFRSIWHFKSALSWWHPSSTSKGCGKQITPSLCSFFNHPLRSARIPSEWKRVNVTPVHKNDRVDSVENCWPISLLCILSETLEHCVCRTLTTMI